MIQLFNENENEGDDDPFTWDLPKLKAPDKGNPISESLASLINTACTQQCQINKIIEKYKVPSNCDFMSAPRVNEEIWSDLMKSRRVQTTDKSLRDIQGLITAGMIPILSLANIIKPLIAQLPGAKDLISDALTLLGQAQFHLSIRRRYLLRPSLKSQYSNICNLSTPITSYLFGDDVSKELKKCETTVKIGKFVPNNRYPKYSQGFGPTRNRGYRGAGRSRPYNNATYGYGFNPRGMGRQPSPYGQFGYQHNLPRGGRKPAAVATATSAVPN